METNNTPFGGPKFSGLYDKNLSPIFDGAELLTPNEEVIKCEWRIWRFVEVWEGMDVEILDEAHFRKCELLVDTGEPTTQRNTTNTTQPTLKK
jgi:hypothetical protein